ncbi:MAG: hypothetical protein MPJ25_08155, partial [Pirellulales bacterium]|nr:hypothetical protein [Pirellulales bacterium]
ELADRVANAPVRSGVVVALSSAVPEPVNVPSIAAVIATNHGFGKVSFILILRIIGSGGHAGDLILYIH